MDNITVKVSDLLEQLQLMKEDKMDNVKIFLLEAEFDEDTKEKIPACISLSAYQVNGDVEVGYDEVYSVK